MKIMVYGKRTESLDQRFNDGVWCTGKDKRIRKSKKNAIIRRNKRIDAFKYELKRTFTLIVVLALITGFIWVQLGVI